MNIVKTTLLVKMFVERMSKELDIPQDKVLKLIEEHQKFTVILEEVLDE